MKILLEMKGKKNTQVLDNKKKMKIRVVTTMLVPTGDIS